MKVGMYLAIVTEALTITGEVVSLRVETKRVWDASGYKGGTMVIDRALGELAEVELNSDDEIVRVSPKRNVPHGIGAVLTAAIDG
jgi:hypothetical protein